MKTILGDYWKKDLTDEEYDEWIKYDSTHLHLTSGKNSLPYEMVLNMFLSHFRRGINLNKTL